jgi:hypothetical protein
MDWSSLRAQALRNCAHLHTPFQELHSILALIGAGSTDAVARLIASHGCRSRDFAAAVASVHHAPASTEAPPAAAQNAVVCEFGRGLLAHAAGRDAATALGHLDRALPCVAWLGGSDAQNALFQRVRDTIAAGTSLVSCVQLSAEHAQDHHATRSRSVLTRIRGKVHLGHHHERSLKKRTGNPLAHPHPKMP